jgi:hypothetical protein
MTERSNMDFLPFVNTILLAVIAWNVKEGFSQIIHFLKEKEN